MRLARSYTGLPAGCVYVVGQRCDGALRYEAHLDGRWEIKNRSALPILVTLVAYPHAAVQPYAVMACGQAADINAAKLAIENILIGAHVP